MSLFSPHSGNALLHTLENRMNSLIAIGEKTSQLTNTAENRSLLKWTLPLITDGNSHDVHLGQVSPTSIEGPNTVTYFDTNTGTIAQQGSYLFWLKIHTVDSYSNFTASIDIRLKDDTLVQRGSKLSSPYDYFRTEPVGGSDDYYTFTHQHSHILQATFPVPKYWKVTFTYEINSYVTNGASPSMTADIYMLPIR